MPRVFNTGDYVSIKRETKVGVETTIFPSHRKVFNDAGITVARAIEIAALLFKYKRTEIEKLLEELKGE